MSSAEPSHDALLAEIAEFRRCLDRMVRESDEETSALRPNGVVTSLASTQTSLLVNIATLRREVLRLQQEIDRLQTEKADLELLLETSTKHSDVIEEDLLQKVEATLRESERQFRLLSETIPVPILVSRMLDSSIVYANEPAEVLLGMPIEQLQAATILEFYAADAWQTVQQGLAVHGALNNYEVQGQRRDGTLFFGALSVRPLTFKKAPCLLCAIYDLSERKRVENEIRILNEALEDRVQKRTLQLEEAHARIVKLEKNALEVQMAGGFAHEMRNALVGAKLMLASVLEADETVCQKNATLLAKIYDAVAAYLPEELQPELVTYFDQLERHEESLDHTLRMVNRALANALGVTTLILEYSRLGRASVGEKWVNLREVIERIIQEHSCAFAEQGITIRATLAETGLIKGHESHFHSMFNNIMLNARDELVELDDNRNRMITIATSKQAESLVVSISDNARGIPEEYRTKIFEPFFSTKPATGTGLGLSFVAKLVPLYHGTLDVTSTMNEGTAFTLSFPVSDA